MKNKYITALYKCLLFIGCILLATACSNDDLDTDQLASSEVLMRSFGPSPIARGAELRIIGTNLDKVESVTIPGAAAITDIKRISPTEIRVTVPQSAVTGRVVLKAGSITITSITDLTYSEPISIDRITPAAVKPGGVIKIEGEYLNLIKEIIFVEDVHVLQADFVSQNRQAIEVTVPKTAQTGKIIVSDGADLVAGDEEPGIPIWVYSDEALNVTLPVIARLSPQPVKPGTELTITGSNFELVEFLRFGGNDIEISQFTVSGDKTEIKALVPATTETGDFRLVAFSGVEVSAAMKLLAPVISGIAPAPAKNGETLTISGTDLDLATSVVFAGNVEGEIVSQTASEIKVTVPASAPEGAITLNTHSGQTAVSEPMTLIKPVISNISPLSITAGDYITITGTSLDLVNEILFSAGGSTVSAVLSEKPSATSITVRSPFTATSGSVGLKTANGTVVQSSQDLTIAQATLPIITEMPVGVKPGALLTLKGINLQKVTRITFVYPSQSIDATQFLPDASGETLQVYVPKTMGTAIVRLYVGDDYVESNPLIIVTTDPVADPELLLYDFEGDFLNGSLWSGVGTSGDVSDGISGKYYEITAATWKPEYWWFAENYMTHPSVTKADHVLKMDIRLRQDIPANNSEVRLMLAGKVVNILPYLLSGDVWTTGGMWMTISIPLTEWADLGDPTPAKSGDWGVATWINGSNFTGFCIDNVRYEKK